MAYKYNYDAEAAAAEAARAARRAAIIAEIEKLKVELNMLLKKLDSYKIFLQNLITLRGNVSNCSINVRDTYEYARMGIVSKIITPKFDQINIYSKTLDDNNIRTDNIIVDVERKIKEIENKIAEIKQRIAELQAELASL